MNKTSKQRFTRKLSVYLYESAMNSKACLSMDKAMRETAAYCSNSFLWVESNPAPTFTPNEIAAARAAANLRAMADYVLNAFERHDAPGDDDAWEEARRFIMEINTKDLTDEPVIEGGAA